VRSAEYVSINDGYAVRWTDGAVTGMPVLPIILVCPHCRMPVWARDLTPRWSFPCEPSDYGPTHAIAPKDVTAAALPGEPFSMAELDEGLRMAADDPARTLAVRRLVWHQSNDPERTSASQPRFRTPGILSRRVVRHWTELGELRFRLFMAGIKRKQRIAASLALKQVIGACGEVEVTRSVLERLIGATRNAAVFEDILFGLYVELSRLELHCTNRELKPAEVENLTCIVGLLNDGDDRARLEKAEAFRELGRWEESEAILDYVTTSVRRAAYQIRCLGRRRISAVETWW